MWMHVNKNKLVSLLFCSEYLKAGRALCQGEGRKIFKISLKIHKIGNKKSDNKTWLEVCTDQKKIQLNYRLVKLITAKYSSEILFFALVLH